MLKELKSTRQIPGEPFRRWYGDADNDLIVWLDRYRVIGFQLLVPGGCDHTVITWHEGQGTTVAGLDDGEGRPGRPKMAPILSQPSAIDLDKVVRHFKTISEEVPSGLAALVEHKIAELGLFTKTGGSGATE